MKKKKVEQVCCIESKTPIADFLFYPIAMLSFFLVSYMNLGLKWQLVVLNYIAIAFIGLLSIKQLSISKHLTFHSKEYHQCALMLGFISVLIIFDTDKLQYQITPSPHVTTKQEADAKQKLVDEEAEIAAIRMKLVNEMQTPINDLFKEAEISAIRNKYSMFKEDETKEQKRTREREEQQLEAQKRIDAVIASELTIIENRDIFYFKGGNVYSCIGNDKTVFIGISHIIYDMETFIVKVKIPSQYPYLHDCKRIYLH